ncbi:MAG: hypothetical protein MJK10_05520 [Pseudomonadales bacterium]|nr:hypothetical protein [Pseudomonadales bacterium]
MKTNPIKFLLIEFILLVAIMALIPFIISVDISVLKNGLSEISITEFAQESLIFIAALVFFLKLRTEPESRGLLILICGLFSMMFIREGDFYLDFVYHGFWKVPVLIVLISTLYYSYKNRATIIAPLNQYRNTKTFTYIFIGFLITVVFSRVFGTGSLWVELSGNTDSGFIKTVVQEGLELFGYSLIFIGSVLLHFKKSADQ